ncbi:MAG: hypothetical protein ACYS29_03060 [Planctomycetota bacterium]
MVRQAMMIGVVKKSSVGLFFSVLLIATYAMNYPLFLGLRPVDIILILFAVWGLLNHGVRSRALLALILMFGVLYFVSMVYGILRIGIIQPRNFAFVYKYSVLFLCIWLVLSSRLQEQQAKFLLKLLLVSFIAIIAYEYLSLYRFLTKYPNLVHKFRPNFPFTDPFPSEERGYLGDAHLFAAYISTGLLAIILSRQYGLLRIGVPFYCLLVAVVFAGMLLTGSRNGIVTFTATVVLCGLLGLAKKLTESKNLARMKRASLQFVFVGVVGVAGLTTLYIQYGTQQDLAKRLLRRAVYFSLSEDESYLGRMRKFSVARDLVLDGPVIIGPGLQSASRSFFDGAVPSILVSAGLGGVCVYATIVVASFAILYKKAAQNQRMKEFQILFFVSLNYILANLITEFFLVSRSVIPFAVFWGLIAGLIHMPPCSRPAATEAK